MIGVDESAHDFDTRVTEPVTWCDGFGAWHVIVPSAWDEMRAWSAIHEELTARGEDSLAIHRRMWVKFVRSTERGTEFVEEWRND